MLYFLILLLLICILSLEYLIYSFFKKQNAHQQRIEKLLTQIRDAFWEQEDTSQND